MKKHHLRGFTLTELAIVMSVIGTVLAGVWVTMSAVGDSKKATRAVAQITEISNNVQDLYAMKKSFKNPASLKPGATAYSNITAMLLSLNAIPADLLVPSGSSTYIQNAWTTTNYAGANSVYIYPAALAISFGPSYDDTYRISYYDVPPAACTKIASGVITNSGTVNANPISLIVKCWAGQYYYTDLTTTTMDAASIGAACATNTTDTCRSVEFDFRLGK